MTRLVYLVLVSLPLVIYYLLVIYYVVNHKDQYTEFQRYSIAKKIVKIVRKNGKIKTEVFGAENLPEDVGYVMYSNHQGKYDALGIISAHEKPCTFLIDAKRSRLPLANEFTLLLEASRLDKSNLRSQARTIRKIIEQVANGRRYIVFPEGGYEDNGNHTRDFLPGAFRCSLKSKTPIIPVAIIDSYKVFGINSLKPVKTQVHFLKPLYYEEYRSMNTVQVSKLVRSRIDEAIRAHCGETAETA